MWRFFFIYINLFVYFWLLWVFVAVRRLSLVVVSGGYSLLCVGFSSCSAWTQQLRRVGAAVVARGL